MSPQADEQASPIVVRVVLLTVWLSLLLGLGAAIVGGPLEDLGSGYGGLGGSAAIVLTASALGGLITAARRPPPRPWLRIGLWPLVVLLVFSGLAHIVDPCGLGFFDLTSYVGTQPLCERFGTDVDVHTRFHLLLHAAVGGIAVVVARRKWSEWRDWPNPVR